MLLPLWPGETDAESKKKEEDPERYIVPVRDRQYLLVYYAPFAEDAKKNCPISKLLNAEMNLEIKERQAA